MLYALISVLMLLASVYNVYGIRRRKNNNTYGKLKRPQG
jgi:hypothetical protein